MERYKMEKLDKRSERVTYVRGAKTNITPVKVNQQSKPTLTPKGANANISKK